MSWKFGVKTILALFIIAVGMGAWISLEALNRKLAEPVRAWNIERVGETYSLRFLGENLPVAFPGWLVQSVTPVSGGMREKLQGALEFPVTREFIREAATAGQIAKREAANCWLSVKGFFSKRYEDGLKLYKETADTLTGL